MTANAKIELEKYIITQTTLLSGKRYFLIGTNKVYFYFEGQDVTESDDYVVMRLVPIETRRIGTGCRYHSGFISFYCYSKTQLGADKIVDALSTIFDEKTISGATARVETGIVSTYQRNKFEETTHYENIARCDFWQWQ